MRYTKDSLDPLNVELKPEDEIAMTVGKVTYVAVVGHAHDWAAYFGIADADRVASNGDKMSQENAERYFPEFAGLDWRD